MDDRISIPPMPKALLEKEDEALKEGMTEKAESPLLEIPVAEPQPEENVEPKEASDTSASAGVGG